MHNTNLIARNMIWLAWIAFIVLLSYFFNSYMENKKNPNRSLKGVISPQGVREVKLMRNARGHYYASGKINGRKVVFLVDTGATTISIPSSVARTIGLRSGRPLQVITANGIATSYATKIDTLELGTIKVFNLRATINPNVQFTEILLGMSVLKNLEIIQRGKHMTIRQYPN